MSVPSTLVFHYPKCSTCRKALKWLEAHGVEHRRVDLSERAPTKAELRKVLQLSGLPINKLYNTSGQLYRGGFKERLGNATPDEALTLLQGNGMLVKRPIVLGENLALVGFKESDYESAFPPQE